jgi:hypothetical protein
VAEKISDLVEKIIEQLTLRNLVYTRQLLSSANLPKTGSKIILRERLHNAIANGTVSVVATKSLLDELDCWGNQRVILMLMPYALLKEYWSADHLLQKARRAGMDHLFDGEIALEPPMELTPMRIAFEERADGRFIKLLAAKTREVWEQQTEIPEYFDEKNYPGIVFKPFKRELQKVVAFAEIGLDSRLLMLSTKKLSYGKSYTVEFAEFFEAFQNLISFDDIEEISLYGAANIIHSLTRDEVSIHARNLRTNSGGTIGTRSHSRRVDVRSDEEIRRALSPLAASASAFCNCIWKPKGELREEVHTHIHAPEGQISILGQINEASARYVLRRILEINNQTSA